MVSTEVAQISGECQAWRNNLRSFKEEFSTLKNRLQHLAKSQTHRETLLEIEHLENQFHIQQINIHDLKQAVKKHLREAEEMETGNQKQYSSELLSRHEQLFEEYQSLESMVSELRGEFEEFEKHIR